MIKVDKQAARVAAQAYLATPSTMRTKHDDWERVIRVVEACTGETSSIWLTEAEFLSIRIGYYENGGRTI